MSTTTLIPKKYPKGVPEGARPFQRSWSSPRFRHLPEPEFLVGTIVRCQCGDHEPAVHLLDYRDGDTLVPVCGQAMLGHWVHDNAIDYWHAVTCRRCIAKIRKAPSPT